MKKKDKKKLVIALVVLAAVILAGLGIWNYAASDGNFLKFNQKSNLQVQPMETQIIEEGMNGIIEEGMNGIIEEGMNGVQ